MATSHADCSKYWVVGIDAKADEWVVILIDSDTGPTPANLRRYDYNSPTTRASNVYGMKFSHDGSMIAIANLQDNAANPDYTANRAQSSFDLFNFDRAQELLLRPNPTQNQDQLHLRLVLSLTMLCP